jgi:hypothetical protein
MKQIEGPKSSNGKAMTMFVAQRWRGLGPQDIKPQIKLWQECMLAQFEPGTVTRDLFTQWISWFLSSLAINTPIATVTECREYMQELALQLPTGAELRKSRKSADKTPEIAPVVAPAAPVVAPVTSEVAPEQDPNLSALEQFLDGQEVGPLPESPLRKELKALTALVASKWKYGKPGSPHQFCLIRSRENPNVALCVTSIGVERTTGLKFNVELAYGRKGETVRKEGEEHLHLEQGMEVKTIVNSNGRDFVGWAIKYEMDSFIKMWFSIYLNQEGCRFLGRPARNGEKYTTLAWRVFRLTETGVVPVDEFIYQPVTSGAPANA